MFQGFKRRLYYLYFVTLLLPELRLQTKRTTAPIYKKLTTLNPPIISHRLIKAWLGSARLGSARLGSARLGSARLHPANSVRGVWSPDFCGGSLVSYGGSPVSCGS